MRRSGDNYFLHSYEKDLFRNRYKDPDNDRETTWESIFRRVSRKVACGSRDLAKEFFDGMSSATFLPSSPQLWNYGSKRKFSRNGSSCFTGKIADSLDSFNEAYMESEKIFVSSGGYGVCGNLIRPRGCRITYSQSGSVGVLGMGGPFRNLEARTGYITSGGRERGALMLQLSAWHPDVIEFILAKKPTSLGFLDDWPTNARSFLSQYERKDLSTAEYYFLFDNILHVMDRYASDYVFRRDWPTEKDVISMFGEPDDYIHCPIAEAVRSMKKIGVLRKDHLEQLIPYVFDYGIGKAGEWRKANRDWDLPLQNCNMSIRIPDRLVKAAREDKPWVLAWYSNEPPHDGCKPWTRTDVGFDSIQNTEGATYRVSEDGTDVSVSQDDPKPYKYGVVITTWAGLKENLKPNPNNWKDSEYARFYRRSLLPEISKYGDGTIMANDIFDLVFRAAHGWGDPGVVFDDTYEKFNPIDSAKYGERLSNPCAEYLSPPGGACNLVSVNQRKASDSVNNSWSSEVVETERQWLSLRRDPTFVDYLNNTSEATRKAFAYISRAQEANEEPTPFIREMSHEHYRIVGIGMMGLAEALIRFHIPYGSDAAKHFAAATMSEIGLSAWEESFRLAKQGWPKPKAWDSDRQHRNFLNRVDSARKYRLSRNHVERWKAIARRVRSGEYATHNSVTSVAPTGSISQIAGWIMSRNVSNGVTYDITITSGIEPPFAWSTHRQDNSGMVMVNHDLWNTKEHKGKAWMRSSSDVTPKEHVIMQAAIAAFCDMGVSKTINLPETATLSNVADAYMLSYDLGVPSATVYRDQSKPQQVLTALDCPSGECVVILDRESVSKVPALPE